MKRLLTCLLMSIVAVSLLLMCSGCYKTRSRTESMTFTPAKLKGGLVKLDIQYKITNDIGKPVTYSFPSSKQFDLWIVCNGKEVFRESNGKTYTQSATSFTLKPGESKAFNVSWTADPASLGINNNTKVVTYAALQSHKPFVFELTRLLL